MKLLLAKLTALLLLITACSGEGFRRTSDPPTIFAGVEGAVVIAAGSYEIFWKAPEQSNGKITYELYMAEIPAMIEEPNLELEPIDDRPLNRYERGDIYSFALQEPMTLLTVVEEGTSFRLEEKLPLERPTSFM